MPEVLQQPNTQGKSISQGTSWKKFGLVILIVLVLIGLGVVIYWLFVLNDTSKETSLKGPVSEEANKTSTESASGSTISDIDEVDVWRTYTNTTSGYRVKYPQNITITESEIEGMAILGTFLPPAEINYGVSIGSLGIFSAVNIDDGYGFNAKLGAEQLKKTSATPMVISQKNVGGSTAYKVEFTSSEAQGAYWVFLDGKIISTAFTFAVGANSSLSSSDIELSDKILSTFEFIE